MLLEIKALQNENEALKKTKVIADENNFDINEHFYGKEITLHYTENFYMMTFNTKINKKAPLKGCNNYSDIFELKLIKYVSLLYDCAFESARTSFDNVVSTVYVGANI